MFLYYTLRKKDEAEELYNFPPWPAVVPILDVHIETGLPSGDSSLSVVTIEMVMLFSPDL